MQVFSCVSRWGPTRNPMRAGGKSKQGPRKKKLHHFTSFSAARCRWRHWKEAVLVRNFFWKKKKVCPFGKGCRISMKSVLWTSNRGAVDWPRTRRPSETFAHFSSFQLSSTVEDCRTKYGTEDLLKMCVLSGKRMDNSSSKLTEAVCYSIWHPSYPTTLSAFSYNGSPSGNALLSSSIKTQRRPVKLSTPVILFFFLSCFFSEKGASLQILGRWKCCSTTLCPLTFLGSSSTSTKGDGTGPDTQTLWWDGACANTSWRSSIRREEPRTRIQKPRERLWVASELAGTVLPFADTENQLLSTFDSPSFRTHSKSH